VDFATFNRYNPDFDKVMNSNNSSYDLRLPGDKIDLFAANKYEILDESVKSIINDEKTEFAIQIANRDMAKKEDE
jgi:membrane-bound lytic murein transglycosylase D